MTRDELVEKMVGVFVAKIIEKTGTRWYACSEYIHGMSAALDVAVEELLKNPPDAEYQHDYVSGAVRQQVHEFFISRRARYTSPPLDLAVDAVYRLIVGRVHNERELTREIVAAVRKADKEKSND